MLIVNSWASTKIHKTLEVEVKDLERPKSPVAVIKELKKYQLGKILFM